MAAIRDVLTGGLKGQEVDLHGWIHRTRSSGGLVFVVLRDASGTVQVTAKKGVVPEGEFADAQKALVESAVRIRGTVHEDPRAPGGYEVRAASFQVVSFADVFPIKEGAGEEFLLDMRHLWIRSTKMAPVWRVRHTVVGAIHEYFRGEGFLQMDPPILTPQGSEGGSTVFELDYFGRTVYLTQSWQLYAEAFALAMEKVYCVAPSFRAEKSRTVRHLTEYWHAEMEVAWEGLDSVVGHGERLISHVCARVVERNAADLTALGRDVQEIAAIKTPFPRMTYTEVVDELRGRGIDFEWGRDLRTEEEREIAKGRALPLMITNYPRISQAFYKAVDPANPKVVLNFDCIGPNGMELIGGSERELSLENLREGMRLMGEDPANYEWYLDSRKYGNVQHAGFGLGVERLVQWICGLEHIRDAVPFPRTPGRYSP